MTITHGPPVSTSSRQGFSSFEHPKLGQASLIPHPIPFRPFLFPTSYATYCCPLSALFSHCSGSQSSAKSLAGWLAFALILASFHGRIGVSIPRLEFQFPVTPESIVISLFSTPPRLQREIGTLACVVKLHLLPSLAAFRPKRVPAVCQAWKRGAEGLYHASRSVLTFVRLLLCSFLCSQTVGELMHST